MRSRRLRRLSWLMASSTCRPINAAFEYDWYQSQWLKWLLAQCARFSLKWLAWLKQAMAGLDRFRLKWLNCWWIWQNPKSVEVVPVS